MSSLIPMAGTAIAGGAQQNMANGQGPLQAYADPGDIFGGNSAQAMDPIGYGVFNALGIKNWDPLVAATNKIPGFQGTGRTGGVPSVLPTLPGVGGPTSYNPNSFGGYANLGPGAYNQMAARMSGRTYVPKPIEAAAAKGMAGSNSAKGASGANSPPRLIGARPVGARKAK